jgi:PAS domain S-box-containing protein
MASILYLGPKDSLDSSRRILLKRAGYKISAIHDVEEAIRLKSWRGCALVILDKTIPRKHRSIIRAELEEAKIGILDLTSMPPLRSDGDHGPEAFLELVGQAVMASHGHPEIRGENVAWVDRDRRYVHVTDGFLQLIGYDRDEVLGRFIDDFTYPGTANAQEVFHRYLTDGHMSGRYLLRHKSGAKVAIEYEAGVLPDGCMYSNMRPAKARKPATARPIIERKSS